MTNRPPFAHIQARHGLHAEQGLERERASESFLGIAGYIAIALAPKSLAEIVQKFRKSISAEFCNQNEFEKPKFWICNRKLIPWEFFWCNRNSLHNYCSVLEGLGLGKGSACFCAEKACFVSFFGALRLGLQKTPHFWALSAHSSTEISPFHCTHFDQTALFFFTADFQTPQFPGFAVHWLSRAPCFPGLSMY